MNWKDLAYEMYIKQDKKDFIAIKNMIKTKLNEDVNYNYIKSFVYKTKDKEKEISDYEESTQSKFPKIYGNEFNMNLKDTDYIQIGIVSDTHLGSTHQQLTYLNEVYDIFADRKITNVFHGGDLTEGFKMRPGHEFDIFVLGADKQTEYVIDKYPKRDNITTHFILGNHDLSHMKNGGTDIGKRISEKRKDMNYLGALNSKIFLTDNCTLELNHPLDGASYALSYAIQKMVDSYSGDAKPNILINSHHHKLLYCFYRNVHCIESGTFEAQTPWMRGKRIAAHVGGLILHINIDKNGTIKSFLPEFITYYNEIKNDY